jgi:CO/xanthine dehydrogenase FAD-binding subunit
LERVDALRGIRDEGESLFIGAGAVLSAIMGHTEVWARFPVLVRAIEVLASPHVRHAGTIGGNIVTASPAGDTLPPLYCLDAELELGSRGATRRVPLRDFIVGPGKTLLREKELVLGVRIPTKPTWTIQHYEKVGKRKAQACAVVSMAALINLTPDGVVEDARLAWGGVGPTVVRSSEIEAALKGKPLDGETLSIVGALARETVNPIDDIRATADYRRMVAGNLPQRLKLYAGSS